MDMLKSTTQHLVKRPTPTPCCLSGVHPDWSMHPSWIAGIEALDAYNSWVCEVLMPIAFQWILEHKEAVYKNVTKDQEDDVGVVIASAFEIVKTMESYTKGLEKAQEFDKDIENGKLDLNTINPVWTSIVKNVREQTKSSFTAKADVLKDTIR
jgi:hypothetical protein